MKTLTIVHSLFGTIALVTGLFAMLVPKRRGLHTKSGVVFHGAVLVTCVTACLLAMEHWASLRWLFFIAVASYVSVAMGHYAARRRWKGWISFHIVCQCSAYISMTTAFLVVNRMILPRYLGIPTYWSWIIPTVIGTPLIAWALGRYSPKKPR